MPTTILLAMVCLDAERWSLEDGAGRWMGPPSW